MDPMLANAVHIARYRSKNPLPNRSLDEVTPAYGAQEMVKLTRLLRHEDTMTRDQAQWNPISGPPGVSIPRWDRMAVEAVA